MTDTKTPKQRVPRNLENIKTGALSLTLEDRVNLVKELQASIQTEVNNINQQAASASNLLSSLNGK